MGDFKHYITVDGSNFITKAFSTAFEQPVGGEIEVADTDQRHFNLNLFDPHGNPRYKWVDPDIVNVNIPERPSKHHSWNGTDWLPDIPMMKNMLSVFIINKAQAILAMSDYLIIQHRDELEEAVSTTITPAEYQAELAVRRAVRTFIADKLTIVENATTLTEIEDIEDDVNDMEESEAVRLGYKV